MFTLARFNGTLWKQLWRGWLTCSLEAHCGNWETALDTLGLFPHSTWDSSHDFSCFCVFLQQTKFFIFFQSFHIFGSLQFSSVTQLCATLRSQRLQQVRLPCPSPTPRAYSNSCPLRWWCHPAISSSVVPFSSHLQPFPPTWSFPMSQFFASGGQSIGGLASVSVLPMNIQDSFPLGLTSLISLQYKRLSRVSSNTTVQKHQFFDTQLSL